MPETECDVLRRAPRYPSNSRLERFVTENLGMHGEGASGAWGARRGRCVVGAGRRWCRATSARGAAGVQRGARAQAVQGRAQEGAGRAGGAGRARRTVWQRAGGRSLCNLSPRRPWSFNLEHTRVTGRVTRARSGRPASTPHSHSALHAAGRTSSEPLAPREAPTDTMTDRTPARLRRRRPGDLTGRSPLGDARPPAPPQSHRPRAPKCSSRPPRTKRSVPCTPDTRRRSRTCREGRPS